MLLNNTLCEIYLESRRDRKRIFDEISKNVQGNNVCVQKLVEKWVKQFERRWSLNGSRKRLAQTEAAWLESDFLVSSKFQQLGAILKHVLLYNENKKSLRSLKKQLMTERFARLFLRVFFVKSKKIIQ